MPRYIWAVVGLVWSLILGGFAIRDGRIYRTSLRESGPERYEGRILAASEEAATAPPAVLPTPPAVALAPPVVAPQPPTVAPIPPADRPVAEIPGAIPPGDPAPSPVAGTPAPAIPPGAVPPQPPGGAAPGLPPGPDIAAAPPLPPPMPEFQTDKPPMALSAEEEMELGRKLNEAILSRHLAVESKPHLDRITSVARDALAARSRQEIRDYHFILLGSESVNTFSHPGGYIYVSLGVFNLVRDDDELQWVLAREVAHVDLRHALRQMEEEGAGEPNLVRRAYEQIARGYSAEQEYEADDWAYRLLRRQGKDHRASIGYLRRLVHHADRRAGGLPPPAHGPRAPDAVNVEGHWLTGPSMDERFRRLVRKSDRPG